MSGALETAIEFARQHEVAWAREPAADGSNWGIHALDPAPWNRLLGPVHARGPVSGVIRRDNQEIASWGEPDRADLTFSVAKTYLALLAGKALERGLIRDINRAVAGDLPGIGFDDAHNRQITWAHLLHQTSEWRGTCWGIPDQVDHFRKIQYQPDTPAGRKGDLRQLQAPGTYWEYNDVRINQLSLALMHLFRRSLPEVFAELLANPIGLSQSWRWNGYENSFVEIDGRRLQSVPGGTHWGGGVSISARDQSLIGQLLLDGGRHGDRQLISPAWVDAMHTPCPIAPWYGYLVWLNTERTVFPSLPANVWAAFGAGGSLTCILPDDRAVVVVRWIDSTQSDRFLSLIRAAFESTTPGR